MHRIESSASDGIKALAAGYKCTLRLAECTAGAQNEVLQAALRRCGHVAVMASEEDDDVIQVTDGGAASTFVAVFDPLDGSRNIDASIPTGTIFGLYRNNGEAGAPH